MEHLWSKIKSYISGQVSSLNTKINGKANSSHTHTYSQITNLNTWKESNFGKGKYSSFNDATLGTSKGFTNPDQHNHGDVYISGKFTQIRLEQSDVLNNYSGGHSTSFFGDQNYVYFCFANGSATFHVYNASGATMRGFYINSSGIKSISINNGSSLDVSYSKTNPLMVVIAANQF